MMVRPANPGELSRWPTAENGEARFVLEDEEIKGYVAVSRIPTPVGEQCWIHDAEHWGEDPRGLLLLGSAARRQVREWNFKEVRTNVPVDSPMFEFWLRHGFEVEQYLLVGEL